MSLNSIMNIGVSGLQTAQTQLRVVSDNISNVNTPGYVRKVVDQTAAVTAGGGAGVDVARVRLSTDRFLQAASMSASADSARYAVRNELYDQIQTAFGDPSGDGGLFGDIDSLFADFTALAETPTSSPARQETIYKTQALFNEAKSVSQRIQALRQEADSRLGTVVDSVNPLLEQIDKLNKTIATATVTGQDATGAQNAQQTLINQLGELMDVKVEARANGGVTIRTNTGATLVGEGHATLSYAPAGTVGATTSFNDIWLTEPSGARSLALEGVGSGEIKGLVELRDQDAPAAAERLAELTARIADELNRAHNASTSVPAPSTLTGRNTGQSLETALAGFSGVVTVATVDAAGVITGQAAIDFTNNPPTDLASLNAQLAGVATASFSNGVLTLNGDGGAGLSIADDATDPSLKGGKGFSHWFGLNDLVVSDAPTTYDTGLTLSSPHGFTPGESVTFRFTGADGARVRDISVAVPAGAGTMGELLSALNNPVTGVGRYGAFSLDGAGALTFKSYDSSGSTLSVVRDTTSQVPSGVTMSNLFGLGGGVRAARTEGFSVRQDIQSNPSKLALAQLNLSAAAGTPALSAADGRGALALSDVGKRTVSFSAAGGAAGGSKTLSNYAADFSGDIGSRAAAAQSRADTASAVLEEANTRRQSKEGVNLDEELVNMTTFQQAYNASARLIQAASDMYDTLIGMLR
ncbi:MAG: flagellar hook-associated protein FlgK [Brevundimonas sp.]|uniref:Flagellar hook-associated protein 1 n=1 Tax=Brevundimonas albigilva TaxID=1312364 RepID=A0ABY4SR77_9CAUL|nr:MULTISPECIES: flagellar hook-associated protein FlgK [Brevundimonas]PZU59652.1 MAG: flagellar hook-associated protein FlgK [Brevundimonas sp.]UQV18995.1 flagellar hook-associated protein FlgK [Brevundimonas albigilva]URI16117.1 flagellar hook-associated protein FlgK [Brevundimonas albigilva]